MLKLLQAAVAYARSQGAMTLEGYPVELHRDETGQWQGVGLSGWYMGSVATFQEAGFQEAAITEQGRRIMRLVVGNGRVQTSRSAKKQSK